MLLSLYFFQWFGRFRCVKFTRALHGTLFVPYKWSWFPRTTGKNGSRLWFSHYRGWNMGGPGASRFAAVRFTILVESAVWLRSGLRDSRLSPRVGSRPVYAQNVSSRTAASPMPSPLGMHSPLRTNSSTFLHLPSPQQPRLVRITYPGGIDCVLIAAQQ